MSFRSTFLFNISGSVQTCKGAVVKAEGSSCILDPVMLMSSVLLAMSVEGCMRWVGRGNRLVQSGIGVAVNVEQTTAGIDEVERVKLAYLADSYLGG